MLVSPDGEVLGGGKSSYIGDAVIAALQTSGGVVQVMSDWVLSFPDATRKSKVEKATLYVTLEPSTEGKGTTHPSIARLIQIANIPRVVIGSPDPNPPRRGQGAALLKNSGVEVLFSSEHQEVCAELIKNYSKVVSTNFFVKGLNSNLPVEISFLLICKAELVPDLLSNFLIPLAPIGLISTLGSRVKL